MTRGRVNLPSNAYPGAYKMSHQILAWMCFQSSWIVSAVILWGRSDALVLFGVSEINVETVLHYSDIAQSLCVRGFANDS